jgi:serine/threonine protein kinase
MIWCDAGGELFEHVASRRAPLTEATAATMARSLLQYLAHVHGLGVAHMDIKPENIMFDCEGAEGMLKVQTAQNRACVWVATAEAAAAVSSPTWSAMSSSMYGSNVLMLVWQQQQRPFTRRRL